MKDQRAAQLQARDANRTLNECYIFINDVVRAMKEGSTFEAGTILAKLENRIAMAVRSIEALERDLNE